MESNPFASVDLSPLGDVKERDVNDKTKFPTGDEISSDSGSVSVFTADDIEDL